MGIKRFFAVKDNAITNAYKSNLRLRGTGSNQGASDILEVFSLYGQAIDTNTTSGSQELSRLLIEFPVSGTSAGEIKAARLAGDIPASGSVSFYLKLYNAKHSQTVPRSLKVNIMAISQSWSEGTGLDMEEYKDLGVSNWISRSSGNEWGKLGGEYHSSSYTAAGGTMPDYTFTFENGTEDLELDVTSLVEEWIAGTQENYGFGIFLTSSQEAYYSSSTGLDANNILHNPDGALDSFYTKKFFGRGSQFFFKKPSIEARWDSADKDNRGNFYYSSSLAPASNNTQTLFLYNYVDGQLTNIPDTSVIYVQLFSGSTSPEGTPISLSQGDYVTSNNLFVVTGGLSPTAGIYTASFATTASSTPLETIYDVWGSGNGASAAGTVQPTQLFTGSFSPSSRQASETNTTPKYRSSISNLKESYSIDENARFRVTVSKKNKTPTVYTKAVESVSSEIVENAYFNVLRMYDNYVIIPFGTGSSSNEYTKMSYDLSGNYFDLDMDMLEPGYQYAIKLAYYLNNRYIEQEEIFRFKVE
jgi:hypothetical protein